MRKISEVAIIYWDIIPWYLMIFPLYHMILVEWHVCSEKALSMWSLFHPCSPESGAMASPPPRDADVLGGIPLKQCWLKTLNNYSKNISEYDYMQLKKWLYIIRKFHTLYICKFTSYVIPDWPMSDVHVCCYFSRPARWGSLDFSKGATHLHSPFSFPFLPRPPPLLLSSCCPIPQ